MASDTPLVWRLLLALALIGLNAFFVVSEFALVSVRRTWVETQIGRGHLRAKSLLSVLDRIDQYFSAIQLGITAASLALGWLGEAAFFDLLHPVFVAWGTPFAALSTHTAATLLAFFTITSLHILFGELAPRGIALKMPERVVMAIVYPLIVVEILLRPVAGVLNLVSRLVLRIFGVHDIARPGRLHSPDELRLLVEQSSLGGALPESERRMLTSVFDFSRKKVDAIMTPRTEMVCIPETIAYADLLRFIKDDQHTRLPVFRGTTDHIVGTLNIKDLIPFVESGKPFVMAGVMREPFFVPEMKPLADLLKEMQHRRAQMAVVVDEFGGTVGLATLEDLLEEIVGEIFDEFDVENAAYETLPDGDVVLDGRTNVDRVNALFGTRLPEGEYNTIGGLVFGAIGRAPKAGDGVTVGGASLKVDEVRARRVTKVRLARGKQMGRG